MCCALLLAALAVVSERQSAPTQSSNVRFTVVKDDNNKPVHNASVILHPIKLNDPRVRAAHCQPNAPQFRSAKDCDMRSELLGYPSYNVGCV